MPTTMPSQQRLYDATIQLEDGTTVTDRVPAPNARQACHTIAADHLPLCTATITATNPRDAKDTARITLDAR